MHGSRAPRVQVCCSRCWARTGAGGSAVRWARWTSGRHAGGQLSTSSCGRPHLGGRCKSSQHMPNEQPLQKVRVSARSSGRQSPRGTCAKDVPSGPRESGQCSSTRLFWRCSSYMVHHGASTRRARPLDAPRKIPVPSHVPGDTSGHGRWTATTRKRQCDGIGTVRWEGAMQTPSRSRTPRARKTTSKTCEQASRSCQKA